MLPPKYLDEALRPYATTKQWEYYKAFVACGTATEAGKRVGVSGQNIGQMLKVMMTKAGNAGYQKPESSVPLRSAKNAKRWARQIPVIQEYIEDSETHLASILSRVPSRAPIDTPLGVSYSDLLACYPVGDEHHGMAAWAHEAGKDWDMKISDETIRAATKYLIAQCPPCEHALIPFLGDFFHYDSYKPLTPQHGNLLDADGRMPKMIDTGWLIVEHMILAALERHQHVHVIWESGNHDEAMAPVTRSMLKRLFRDNPRVTIDDSNAFWHYYQFGKVMIWTNHGDRCTKSSDQAAVASEDQAVMWGNTTYRMGMLGHWHHEERKAVRGAVVERFAVLPPEDSHAHRGGYRSMQQMHALVFHREGRLQSRHMFYPDQVEVK